MYPLTSIPFNDVSEMLLLLFLITAALYIRLYWQLKKTQRVLRRVLHKGNVLTKSLLVQRNVIANLSELIEAANDDDLETETTHPAPNCYYCRHGFAAQNGETANQVNTQQPTTAELLPLPTNRFAPTNNPPVDEDWLRTFMN